jgi:hypothetical protein
VLYLAIEETYEESGRRFRPWAANGEFLRVADIILIVDSNKVAPEVRLRAFMPSWRRLTCTNRTTSDARRARCTSARG